MEHAWEQRTSKQLSSAKKFAGSGAGRGPHKTAGGKIWKRFEAYGRVYIGMVAWFSPRAGPGRGRACCRRGACMQWVVRHSLAGRTVSEERLLQRRRRVAENDSCAFRKTLVLGVQYVSCIHAVEAAGARRGFFVAFLGPGAAARGARHHGREAAVKWLGAEKSGGREGEATREGNGGRACAI